MFIKKFAKEKKSQDWTREAQGVLDGLRSAKSHLERGEKNTLRRIS